MGTSRILTVGVVAGSVLVASVFAAAPASAAALPSGQRITVIDTYSAQFHDASPVDAALTAVGTGVPVRNTSILGVDVKDDGVGYAVGTQVNTILIPNGLIFPANAATGTLGEGVYVDVLLDGADEPFSAQQCTAIDYTGAAPWVSCSNFYDQELGPDMAESYIGPIDPVTGVLYPEFVFGAGSEAPQEIILAIALDPITGLLWFFTYDYDLTQGWAYTWDAEEGIDAQGDLGGIITGADFDRDGVLWITTDEIEPESLDAYSALAILNLDDGDLDFLEMFTVGAAPVDSSLEPITVWGAPALAATGVTNAVPLAAGAAGILLLGALLAAGVTMRRRLIAE